MLAAAFERVAISRSGPEVVVVAGEAGLGKTRLVQEFYNYLSTTYDGIDGAGYWPDDLGQVENNLKVNPNPEACIEAHSLPFLWWGLRLDDPGEKNASVAGAVPAALQILRPHLEPMYQSRARQARRGEATRIVGRGAIDALIDLIPGAGLAKTGAKTVFDLSKVLGKKEPERQLSLSRTTERERRSQNDMILDALGQLLDPDGGAVPPPTVILFDDGQFSPADPGARELLEGLMDQAAARRWPLLILVTHWFKEWHDHHEEDAPPSIARAIMARVDKQKSSAIAIGWLELKPIADLALMLGAALPALLSEQAEALLERAGGNPRYLEQIIALARGRPRYFEGRDTAAALSARGLTELLTKSVSIHETVEQRIHDAGEDVRRALAIASLQGMRFSTSLAGDTGTHLELGDIAPFLEPAEYPHAFIRRSSNGIGEFTQRIFHDVSRDALADVTDNERAKEALLAALRERLVLSSEVNFFSAEDAAITFQLASNAFEFSHDTGDLRRSLESFYYLMLFEKNAGRLGKALEYAERVIKGAMDDRWNITDLSIWKILELIELLLDMRRIAPACRAAELGVLKAHQQLSDKDAPSMRAMALTLTSLADVLREAGPTGGGSSSRLRTIYETVGLICSRLAELHPTPENLRTPALALDRLGDILETIGDYAAAYATFREVHRRSHEMCDRFNTVDSQRDLLIANLKLARFDAPEVSSSDRRRHAEQGLYIARSLVAKRASPDARSDLCLALQVRGDFHLFDDEIELAKDIFLEFFDLAKDLVEELPAPNSRRNFGGSLLKLGKACSKLEEQNTSREYYEKAQDIFSALVDEFGTHTFRRDLAESQVAVALSLKKLQKFDLAKDKLKQALRLQSAISEDLDTPTSHREFAYSLSHLGDVLVALKQQKDAQETYKRALDIYDELDQKSDRPTNLRNRALISQKLGEDLMSTQQQLAAVAIFEQACAFWLLSPKGTLTIEDRQNLGVSHAGLSKALLAIDNSRGAREASDAAIEVFEDLAAATGAIKDKRNLVVALREAGDLLQKLSDYAAAQASYSSACEQVRMIVQKEGNRTDLIHLARLLISLGDVQQKLNDTGTAGRSYQEALDLRRRMLEASADDIGRGDLVAPLDRLGDVLLTTEGTHAALANYKQALAICDELVLDGDRLDDRKNCLILLRKLANLLVQTGDPAAAEAAYERAIQSFTKIDEDRPTSDAVSFLIILRDRFGELLLGLKKPEAAKVQFESLLLLAREIDQKQSTQNSLKEVGITHYKLAEALSDLKQPGAAQSHYEHASEILRLLVAEQNTPEMRRLLMVVLNRMAHAMPWYEGIDEVWRAAEILVEVFWISNQAIKEHSVSEQALADGFASVTALGKVKEALKVHEEAMERADPPPLAALRETRTRLLAVVEAEMAAAPNANSYKDEFARVNFQLGQAALLAGEPASAISHFDVNLAIRREIDSRDQTADSARQLVIALENRMRVALEGETMTIAQDWLAKAISAAEIYAYRAPGVDAEGMMEYLLTMQRSLSEEDDSMTLSELLLRRADGDRTMALGFAQKSLDQWRAQHAETPSERTAEYLAIAEAAVEELQLLPDLAGPLQDNPIAVG